MKLLTVLMLSLVLTVPGLAQPAGEQPVTETHEAQPEPTPDVTPAIPVAPASAATRVVNGLKGDVFGGGWIAATVLNGAANTIVRSIHGEAPDEAAKDALHDLTKSEFLVGSLLAGSAGAALGAALPIPILRGAPLFLRTASSVAAPLAFASVASTLGTNAILLHRRGKLTFENLMKSVDWTNLAAQTIGSMMGMSLGATLVAAGLAPALALGSVAIVPVLGGIAGAVAASQLLSWIRTKRMKPDAAAKASTQVNATGVDPQDVKTAPIEAPGGSGVINGVPGGTLADVPLIDFADLPKAEPVVHVP